jgi:Hypothetical glycosyl hydrolase 6
MLTSLKILAAGAVAALAPLGGISSSAAANHFPLHREDAAQSSGSTLPDWYDGARVQGHTRLPLRYLAIDSNLFYHAGASFKKMGAHVFTRWIKGSAEGAWWPSKVGAIAPEAADKNIAKLIIDEAHQQGLRIIAYHRHMEDDAMAEQHPDWVCKDVNGAEIKTRRGVNMSFSSPYVDFYMQRGIELLKLGVDGFYFDDTHQPPTGDFSDFAKNAYKQETGYAAPNRVAPRDANYQRYIDFQNRVIARTFMKWRKAFKAVKPDMVMLINANRWNSFGSRHLNEYVFEAADSVKTEYNVGSRKGNNMIVARSRDMQPVENGIRTVLAWIVARDAADGRPPHIWTAGLTDESSAIAAASAVMAIGGIANLDVGEKDLPQMSFQSSFALGDLASPTLAGSKPLKWLGIVYSESARDRSATNEVNQWHEVYYPVYGAFRAAFRGRIPCGIVFDRNLDAENLNGVKVLYVPNPDALSDRQNSAIRTFERAGGKVIRQKPGWDWAGESADGTTNQQFLRTVTAAATPPIEVTGGPRDMITGFFTKGGDTIVTIAGDGSWVKTGGEEADNEIEKSASSPSGPISGVQVTVNGPKPSKVVDVITGRSLAIKPTSGGFRVAVPDITQLAVLDIQR